MVGAVLRDVSLQFIDVVPRAFGNLGFDKLVLVGVGLEMGRIRVQGATIDHLATDGLDHDLVENLLIHRALVEATATVLADGRSVGNLVFQAKAQKPAIGDIDFDLFNQPPLTADAKQIPQKEHLEEHCRIKSRSAIVRTVQVFDLVVDETKIDELGDLAEEMILGNQALDADKFVLELFGSCAA